jgi:hypothetical protein|nr:MAG TPA: hypothetical protein [Caudoviricetes sp.]
MDREKLGNEFRKYMFDLLTFVLLLGILAINFFVIETNDIRSKSFWVNFAANGALTMLIWTSRYLGAVSQRKQGKRAKAARNAVNQLIGHIIDSKKVDGLDEFCVQFADNDLKGRRKRLLGRVGVDYADFDEIYQNMDIAQIRRISPPSVDYKKLSDEEKKYQLTKKKKKAIIKAYKMKEPKVNADMLLTEQDDGKEKAFSLGRSEAAQKRHDISLKGVKYILTAVITSYFTMKLVQNPSWETVANIIKDLIPMTTSAVMATKSGIEAVDNNIVTRYQKRRRLLIQFCDKNAIPTDINSELGESQL